MASTNAPAGKLGIQITPWSNSAEIVEVGRKLSTVVDTVFVQDQVLARNVYALMSALAYAGCGVGSNVTYPIGRNPIEMASAAATISELIAPEREMIVGMGTGGALVNSLFRKDRPVTAVREAIQLMRALWAGDRIELDGYPVLGAALGYRPGATAKLTYPVERAPAIIMAATGPKILAVAGRYADGLISSSNLPTQSRAAFATGEFAEVSGLSIARRARQPDAPPLRQVFGINVSISMDRERAREHARRQATLSAGNPRLWPGIERVGLDMASAAAVKDAFDAGLGVVGAAQKCSAALADALIISGTPDECVPAIAEIRDLAAAEGYTDFYIGAPLGPDPLEASSLLISQVIPQVWPERRAAA